MQHNGGLSKPGRVLSKFAKLVPPPQGNPMATSQAAIQRAIPKIAGLYRGVFGAASGAGIAIGAYFAFYGAATNLLVRHSKLSTGQIAFVAGAAAAAGGSVVKVPLAVCIRYCPILMHMALVCLHLPHCKPRSAHRGNVCLGRPLQF